MIITVVLEIMLFVGIALFVVTQMLVPALRGRRLFPMFRKAPTTEVQRRLEDINSEIDAMDLEQELAARRAELERKRSELGLGVDKTPSNINNNQEIKH